MKKMWVAGLCLFMITRGFAQQADKAAKLLDLIQSVNVPGIQLIYSKDGQTEEYDLGVAAYGAKSPITKTSIFEAASLSKAVFGYTVLRLVDKGVIALDTPLLNYMGGSYSRFDPSNPQYRKITARLVLSHRTGFRNWADEGIIPFLFPPDSCFNYSGEAYLFLMTVLERVTHKDLNQLAAEETFNPLAMSNSSFRWDPKFAAVSTFGSDSNAIHNHMDLNAASSLLTNAHDYNLFLDALVTGKGLKPATHKLMIAQATPGNWFNHPTIPATQHIGWGLGVGIQQNEKGKALWQWGDNGDYRAFYIAFPATNEHLVYFTNGWRGHYITQPIIDLFMGKQTTWAIPWLRNGYAHDPYAIGYQNPYAVNTFRRALEKSAFKHVRQVWDAQRANDPSFTISAKDLKAYAGILRDAGQLARALKLSTLNVAIYPTSSDAFDDQGESYAAMGQKELAIASFKKSLTLDPKNQSANERLKALEK